MGSGQALAAFAKGALAAGGHQARLESGLRAGAVGDDNERAILKPAQQGPVGCRAQGPGPIVFLRVGGAGLGGEPLHHFIESIEREVDDSGAANAHILTQRRQKRSAHGLDGIAAGQNRRDAELALVIGVDNGKDAEIRPQKLYGGLPRSGALRQSPAPRL